MPFSGNVLPVTLGIALTSSIGWSTYVTKQVFDTQTQVAVVSTRLEALDKRLDAVAMKTDIRDLRIVIREALASALGEGYKRKQR